MLVSSCENSSVSLDFVSSKTGYWSLLLEHLEGARLSTALPLLTTKGVKLLQRYGHQKTLSIATVWRCLWVNAPGSCCHLHKRNIFRITQNGLGWTGHQGSSISNPPHHRPGHQPPHLIPDQSAKSSIQPGLEHLRGRGIYNLSRQPVPAPHHSPGKELPPNFQPKSSLFQLKTIFPCLAVIYPFKEFSIYKSFQNLSCNSSWLTHMQPEGKLLSSDSRCPQLRITALMHRPWHLPAPTVWEHPPSRHPRTQPYDCPQPAWMGSTICQQSSHWDVVHHLQSLDNKQYSIMPFELTLSPIHTEISAETANHHCLNMNQYISYLVF